MEQDDILNRFTLNDTAEITNTGEEIGRGGHMEECSKSTIMERCALPKKYTRFC